MTEYKIAVIPGDGIGKEVVPEGMRVLEAVGKRYRDPFHLGRLSVVLRDLHENGPDDAGRRDRAAEDRRCHLSWGCGVPGGPGSRFALGAAPAHPQGDGAVHQLPAGPNVEGDGLPASGQGIGRHRLRDRPRKQRRGVFRDRRAALQGNGIRDGGPGGRVHEAGRGPGPALRLRSRQEPSGQAPDLGHQIQRYHPHHDLLG